ncbi:MAG: hypothetical protein JWQ49_5774 [Edaphobacter sp.]|nr:hypothetical protein [Edaphobacter sp.]
MATEQRGSEKLLSELIKKGSAATPDEVKAAVAVPAAVDYKLLRWLIRGIPPVYYEVETLFQVRPDQVSDIVKSFTANERLRGIDVFIYGIPKPDIAHVSATIAQGEKAAG